MPENSPAGTDGRPDSAVPPASSNRTMTPAVAVALVILAASFLLSVAFVLANGGLDLPAAAGQSRGSGALASASSPGGSESAPTISTGVVSEPVGVRPISKATSATRPAAPAMTPQGTAAPAPDATTAPAPRPSAAPAPRPSSSTRQDLLAACSGKPDCWIYVVRRGDNLISIANYFGVSLKEIADRNPWTTTTRLLAGQKLILPTPRR